MNKSHLYIVYKTTNKINNKFYVGVHKTSDLDNDCYYGSGKYLLASINKYGKWNFEREVLHIYHSERVAYKRESYIVNKEFLEREDTMNLKLGGIGGFLHTKESLEKAKRTRKLNGTDQCKHLNEGPLSSEIRRRSVETRRAKGTLTLGIHSKESRDKVRLKKRENGTDRMSQCHSMKARLKRIKVTLERAMDKHPELSSQCQFLDSHKKVIFEGTLYDLNVFLYTKPKAMTQKKVTIPMFHSGRSFSKGKWKGHYIQK